MIWLLVLVGVFIVAVAVMAWRHDRRQRGWTGWSDGRPSGNVRRDNESRGGEWSL